MAKKILCVDDYDGVIKSLKFLLESYPNQKYAVDIAASADEAMQKFKSGGYDLVIVDYNMGNTNGVELAKQLQAEEPGLPIIMFTATDEKTIAQRHPEFAEMRIPHLPKPCNTEMLELLIRGRLNERELRMDGHGTPSTG